MSDIYPKEKRSEVMSKVSRKDTKQEMVVRRALFKEGFRYRTHITSLPGSPDIVLPKYRTAVFVHGCFWHGHIGCKAARLPKSRQTYWRSKIQNNMERDQRKVMALRTLGWNVTTVWQCELSTLQKRQDRCQALVREIRSNED